MITITARINISENGGSISGLEINGEGNNISSGISSVMGKNASTRTNAFILDSSKLDSGAYLVDRVNYFIGAQLSDEAGNFSTPYTLTINGSNISTAIIVFDKENGRHPNTVIVDGETFYDDDAQFELVFNSASDTHTVVIPNWNTPNSPLIITSIYAEIDIYIDRRNLLSFNSDIVDRADTKYPSYGIISNSANLTFSDLDEQVLDFISQKVLHSGIKVNVWLNNSDNNAQEQVCVMETRELSYDNDNRQVRVTLKDNLEEWQEINVEALNYYEADGTPKSPKTAKWLYEYLLEKTPKKFIMHKFDELSDETKSVLDNTTIKYPTLESSTLWDAWQKLCELCLLHIYVDNNGVVVCKYNNGN